MAACVLCEEINELFLESLVELLFGRPRLARNLPNGGDTSRVAMSPIVYTACAYGLRLRLAPTACAYGLRLRLAPTACAYGLRLRLAPTACAYGLRLRLAFFPEQQRMSEIKRHFISEDMKACRGLCKLPMTGVWCKYREN